MVPKATTQLVRTQLVRSDDLAALVRRTRTASGLTKSAFATESGITRAALDQYEKGTRSPRVDTLTRMLSVTGDCIAVARVDSSDLPPGSQDLATFVASLDTEDPLWCWRSLVSDFVANEFIPSLRHQRAALLARSPGLTGSRRWDAFIAALAEHVCGHAAIDPPGWSSEPDRGPLGEFWWPVHGELPSTRAAARTHSPAAFARRCILIDGRELGTVVP